MTNTSQLKFVVLKGNEGFGDRLQCLLEVIIYAKVTKRIIVIDWRDSDWAHVSRYGADYYFKINLPSFEFDSFSIYYKNMMPNLTVYPSIWKNHMLDENIKDFTYKNIFQIKSGKESIISKISNLEIKDFEEDVIVVPSVGIRSYKYNAFQYIEFNKWIDNKIRDFVLENKLISKKYDVIHLRAGSKSWANGSPGNMNSYKKHIEDNFPNLESYLDYVFQEYKKILKTKIEYDLKDDHVKKVAFSKTSSTEFSLFLISDSDWLISKWIERFGIGISIRNETSKFRSKSGTHKLSKVELELDNTDKVNLNYNLILDFHFMLNARHVISDNFSLFSKMAAKIGIFKDVYLKF